MDVDDLILVSVDGHVVEPPTVFEDRLPAEARGARRAGREVAIRSSRKTPKTAHANRASDLGTLTNS